jgi:hypothetical protein
MRMVMAVQAGPLGSNCTVPDHQLRFENAMHVGGQMWLRRLLPKRPWPFNFAPQGVVLLDRNLYDSSVTPVTPDLGLSVIRQAPASAPALRLDCTVQRPQT